MVLKKIVLTGGGSAGHVTGNIALLPELKKAGWAIEYIGSETGIERQIIADVHLPYHAISTGKLRRYFDLKNFKDPFRVIKGALQAYSILRKSKPQVVFSKGGFVAVPVILGAWLNRIPVIIHESDMTPGLANKISIPLASKVCFTFPETQKHIPADKAVYTGSPIRDEVLQGDPEKGRALCGFTTAKPVLLIIGGSLGSEKINQAVRASLDALLPQFQIIHLCGKGNIDPKLADRVGYKQFEYITTELPDIFAMIDIAVSRAGSNTIFELLALKKPHVLIPLSRAASRGDQILNADSFARMGYSKVLYEEDMTPQTLQNAVKECYNDRDRFSTNMRSSRVGDAVQTILQLIEKVGANR